LYAAGHLLLSFQNACKMWLILVLVADISVYEQDKLHVLYYMLRLLMDRLTTFTVLYKNRCFWEKV